MKLITLDRSGFKNMPEGVVEIIEDEYDKLLKSHPEFDAMMEDLKVKMMNQIMFGHPDGIEAADKKRMESEPASNGRVG